MTSAAEFQERLEQVVCGRLPDCLELLAAERLSGGASQETYRLRVRTGADEQSLCLRRAPGGVVPEERVAPGLATEAALMALAAAAGVPEPEVYYVLAPDDGLGEGFVMQWLEGETLGARIARAPELAQARHGLAYQCGQVLARIHAIDIAGSGLAGSLQTQTPESFVREMWDRYQAFETPQPMIDYTARWLLEHLPATPRSTLVHNDFRNGNLLVGPEGIRAVLDWEVAHIGDPMRDLGWICTNSWRFGVTDKPVGGFGDYQELFDGYAAVAGEPVDPGHVRFWEVFGSFWWAIGCLSMAEHYRHGPDRSVERPAIGRRSSECQVDCVNLLIPGPVTLVPGAAPGAAPPPADPDAMPRTDELLVAVRDFLRDDVMSAVTGRSGFLARVAGNSLDIVRRELALGAAATQLELEGLRPLVGSDGTLSSLRWRLVRKLRDASLKLDDAALQRHLRDTVVNRVAIDQPRYSGFATACAQARAS